MGWVNANMESYEKKFFSRFDEGLEGLIKSAEESINKQTAAFSQKLDDMHSSINSKVMILNHDCTKLEELINNSHLNVSNMKQDTLTDFEKKSRDILTNLQQDIADKSKQASHPVTPQKPQKTSNLFQNKWRTIVDADLPHYRPYSLSRHATPFSPPPYQGVRTDIIRKNVKVSCQDKKQLLDFFLH